MKSLKQILTEAEKKKVAVGHFNIAELSALKAIFQTAKSLGVPVIIGVSEGERDFLGVRQIAAYIRSLREEYNFPIFLNADHTHSLEKIEAAAQAGFDAVLFDGSQFSAEENLRKTKEAVLRAKYIKPDILVEGELGNIGSGSTIRKELPKGAAIRFEDLTKPEKAEEFVKETGVDLLAPAVGNIHGMFASAPEPALNISRIKEIRKAVKVPLVLHGASGNTDKEVRSAIEAGMAIVHISTELRVAWRKGMEKGLKENPEEIAPYKILPAAIGAISKVTESKLKTFYNL